MHAKVWEVETRKWQSAVVSLAAPDFTKQLVVFKNTSGLLA